jgi:hypothetical protein
MSIPREQLNIPLPTSLVSAAAATFSWTAPLLSEADLENEHASLSAEESYRIDSDKQGSFAILRESPEMIACAEAAVAEALQRIDGPRKVAYSEAVEICPDLVHTESDYLRFLRCENFDPEVCQV